MGHGPQSSNCCVVLRIVCLVSFYVLFVCKCVLLPPGDNPIAVNKYIIYHIILYSTLYRVRYYTIRRVISYTLYRVRYYTLRRVTSYTLHRVRYYTLCRVTSYTLYMVRYYIPSQANTISPANLS